jgi:hypothetical protein
MEEGLTRPPRATGLAKPSADRGAHEEQCNSHEPKARLRTRRCPSAAPLVEVAIGCEEATHRFVAVKPPKERFEVCGSQVTQLRFVRSAATYKFLHRCPKLNVNPGSFNLSVDLPPLVSRVRRPGFADIRRVRPTRSNSGRRIAAPVCATHSCTAGARPRECRPPKTEVPTGQIGGDPPGLG